VLSYEVARRTNEIEVRVALGAARQNILWMVLRDVIIMAALGVALGAPSAVVLSRPVSNGLFGIQPYDPVTLAAATVILTSIALLAFLLPVRRAARIDPPCATSSYRVPAISRDSSRK
jgi:ABC-type antimicrobial peptide transport system permease subunit